MCRYRVVLEKVPFLAYLIFIEAEAEEGNGFSDLLYNLLHVVAGFMASRDLVVTGLIGGFNISWK